MAEPISFNVTTLIVVGILSAVGGVATYVSYRIAQDIGKDVGGPRIELPQIKVR